MYLGGLLTGLVLILYPALGPIFTSKGQFGFSTAQFGHIFIPQAIFAILASVGASFLVSKQGVKRILLSGLLALTVSTLLLFVSHYFVHDPTAALGIILFGTCLLGIGFGLVITVLNPMASGLFPNNPLAAISGLHFALGLGTVGAPLLVGMVKDTDAWWYLPLMALALGLVELGLATTLSVGKSDRIRIPKNFSIPLRLWGFIMIVTLYGLCEGTFGSFGSIFLQKQGLSEKSAAGGLALFWGGLALGRILFGLLSVKFSMSWFYKFAPLVVAILLVVMPLEKTTGASLLLMTVSGLMMSALFPGSVSWSTGEYKKEAILVSGLMVAALELGTGISTNFLGLLSKTYSLDAMDVSGTNPFKYLVVTRVVATSLVLPILVMYADAFALAGAFVAVNLYSSTSLELYLFQVFDALAYDDVLTSLIKPVFFGLAIGMVSTYFGYYPERATTGVGQAATSSVVVSMVFIFIIDFMVLHFLSLFSS